MTGAALYTVMVLTSHNSRVRSGLAGRGLPSARVEEGLQHRVPAEVDHTELGLLGLSMCKAFKIFGFTDGEASGTSETPLKKGIKMDHQPVDHTRYSDWVLSGFLKKA